MNEVAKKLFSILHQDGEIFKYSNEYKEALNAFCKYYKQLENSLNDEQKELFEKMFDYKQKYDYELSKTEFYAGLKLGLNLAFLP